MDTADESRSPASDAETRSLLTPRERDVLSSLRAGRSYRETARVMRITMKELEALIASVFRKLNVGGGGLAGVREPRRPSPSDDSGEATADKPNR